MQPLEKNILSLFIKPWAELEGSYWAKYGSGRANTGWSDLYVVYREINEEHKQNQLIVNLEHWNTDPREFAERGNERK